jgi:hypothetical protein
LFQPVSGKIKSNFVQISGKSKPIEGLFYAAGISSKKITLTKDDVPERTFIFPDTPQIIGKNCLHLFPNSTNIKPAFWKD